MKCTDVQRVLPEVMDNWQDGELEAHLKSCPACAELVSDLKLISSEARQLSAGDEPAPRVWVRIAAELRAEGLIREPAAIPAPAAPRRNWKAWWLVPVAAALLAGASYMVSHKAAPQVAQKPAPVATPAATAPSNQTPATVAQAPGARVASQPKSGSRAVVSEAPSPEDEQFLSEVSERAPGMRATYESQLRAVNAYIREAQAYLSQNPDDEDARQLLMEAYHQKAMLYQMALDRVQ